MWKFRLPAAVLLFGSGALAQSATQAMIEVSDQEFGGNQVIIDQVVAPGGGFVAIHEVQESDGTTFASAIGHVRVDPGTTRDVTVPVEPFPRDGATLAAVLHADTGETGTFEYDGDEGNDLVVDIDGKPVMATFEVM
jgi:hypothetical protein